MVPYGFTTIFPPSSFSSSLALIDGTVKFGMGASFANVIKTRLFLLGSASSQE